MWFIGDCYFYKFFRFENIICICFIFIIERFLGNFFKYLNYVIYEK